MYMHDEDILTSPELKLNSFILCLHDVFICMIEPPLVENQGIRENSFYLKQSHRKFQWKMLFQSLIERFLLKKV